MIICGLMAAVLTACDAARQDSARANGASESVSASRAASADGAAPRGGRGAGLSDTATTGVEAPAKEAVVSNETDLKRKLTDEQYYVTQQCGTERAFTGKYWNHKGDGTYLCVVCGADLFDSNTKFDSGSGWPSFYDVLTRGNVKQLTDASHGMTRIEVRCAKCNAHLGHVFDDGPRPTGQRYCINSASLEFRERNASDQPPAASDQPPPLSDQPPTASDSAATSKRAKP